jgi:superfamily II DNA or RNA helicase
MPQYRGTNIGMEKIRLYDMRSQAEVYVGLLDKVIDILTVSTYGYTYTSLKIINSTEHLLNSMKKFHMRVSKITCILFAAHTPRKYQIEGVYGALKHNRKLLISPTASGKSLMIYSLVRYYVDKGEKILLVVPTTSLVEQMYKDFLDYGWDADSYCHRIYSGREGGN